MSIGIELVNWGELKKIDDVFYCWPGGFTRRYDVATYGKPEEFVRHVEGVPVRTYWAPYTEEQKQALVKLCQELVQRYPEITRTRIVGHEDVAPGRKKDPGPALDLVWVRDRAFVLPDELYLEYSQDDPKEEELAQRQQDRAEPLTWYQRVIAILNGFRG